MLVFLCCVYLRSEEFDVNILVNHMIALLARPRMKWPVSEDVNCILNKQRNSAVTLI